MSNNHNQPDIRNDKGFTLVEVLVTIIAAITLIFALNSIYTTQVYISQSGRDTAIANSYVEGKFETLRSKGYLGLAISTTNITGELPSELNDPKNASLVISQENTATKKLIITITYNQQGRNQTYSYTAYIGELGVGQY